MFVGKGIALLFYCTLANLDPLKAYLLGAFSVLVFLFTMVAFLWLSKSCWLIEPDH